MFLDPICLLTYNQSKKLAVQGQDCVADGEMPIDIFIKYPESSCGVEFSYLVDGDIGKMVHVSFSFLEWCGTKKNDETNMYSMPVFCQQIVNIMPYDCWKA